MTSKIEESDSYAMLCLSLWGSSILVDSWPLPARAGRLMLWAGWICCTLVHLFWRRSSRQLLGAKHISSPQNATFEIRLVWFFTSFSKWCVCFYFRLHWLLLFQHVCRWTQRPGFEGTMAQCPQADSCLCCFEKSPLENRHNIYQFKIS